MGVVYLNRPQARNALEHGLREELKAALAAWAEDPQVRAVIITGRGAAFCAGGDLKSLGRFRPAEGRQRVQLTHRLIATIRAMDKPVLAAVNGPAFGAGWSLVLACDLAIAAEEARFCQSFTRVGLIPDNGALYFLPRLVGLARAKELAMTGRIVEATEALELGLVNQVVPQQELLPTALALAQELAAGPPVALGYLKHLANRSFELDLASFLEQELLAQDICMATDDHREGVEAFFSKRRPNFGGPARRD